MNYCAQKSTTMKAKHIKLIPLSQSSILCSTMKQHSTFYLPPPFPPQCSFLCHKTYLLAICAHIFLFFFLEALWVVYRNTARNWSWWSGIIFFSFQWYLSRAEGCSNLSRPKRGVCTFTVLSLLHDHLFPFIDFFQVVFWAPCTYTHRKKKQTHKQTNKKNQLTNLNAEYIYKRSVKSA